jgi:hypothetical protein
MVHRVILLISVICLTVSSASAQAPTSPATQPSSVPVDTSSPQGTLKVLAGAMDQGDEETLRSLILAEGSLETRMRDAQISLSRSTARLRDAMLGAFGQQAMAELNTEVALQQRLAGIDGAQADVKGDAARISIGPDRYDLKRVDGKWKLVMGAAAKNVDPRMLEQSLEEISIRSTVYHETAQEVADGKYQNLDEVGQALQGKLMVAMMRQAASKESPATQPK